MAERHDPAVCDEGLVQLVTFSMANGDEAAVIVVLIPCT
jgi:hypothetical protein